MPRVVRSLLLVVAVVASAIAILLVIAQDQDTLRIRTAVPADDSASPGYLAALTGAPTSTANQFELLRNGDEIFPPMLAAIDGARSRISFETYIFEDGAVADQFVAALSAAAHRGVSVSLVVDSFGGSAMSEEHVEQLRAAGCQIASYNKASWYQLEDANYRTHRKILVVDGDIAFTGGVGVADHWMGNAQDPEHWRDSQVLMRGPLARLVEGVFYENFIEGGGVVTPALHDVLARPEPSTEHAVSSGAALQASSGAQPAALIVRSAPTGGSNALKQLYLLLIASARRSLDITTPYFVTDESTMWALRDAVGRGVRVRILMEGENTDAMPVKYASRRNYEQLLEAGIELHEYQPTMMHSKIMNVDQVWSMFGSANFDNRSLELNDELNIAVWDADLARRFDAMFADDLARARRIDLGAWRRRPMLDKTRERFWGYWGEIF